MEDVFKHSDFITLHVPAQEGYVIGTAEFAQMKDHVGLVNCARGGVIDEVALIAALDANKVLFAGLDVFENEPTPEVVEAPVEAPSEAVDDLALASDESGDIESDENDPNAEVRYAFDRIRQTSSCFIEEHEFFHL